MTTTPNRKGSRAFLPAAAFVAGLGFIATTTQIAAQDYYQGKTINVIVGNVSSSGYDPYGRVLARHMPKYIPGKPTMIVQNMPGAGSIKATDYTYNVAPKDGTAITLVMPGALMEPLTGADPTKFRYDATKFAYLGTADAGTRLCFTRGNSAVKSLDDARKSKAIMAATAAGSSLWDYPSFMKVLGGAQFSIVTGYPGPRDAILAVERGEADGICGLELSTMRNLRPDWFTPKRDVNLIGYIALQPNPTLEKLGVADIWKFIPEKEKPVVELIVAQQVFQRPFLAPPGTPPAQLKILREAFMATWRDKEALEDAAKMKIDVTPKSGEEVEALVKKIYAAPKELVARMAKAIRP